MRDHEGRPTGGRGLREKLWRSPGAKIGHENREAVRRFFADHVGCTNVECAAAIGLSVMAVGRHVATLRKEWIE